MKKLIPLIFAVFLFAAFIPFASASATIMFQSVPTSSFTTTHLFVIHPTGGAYDSAASQVFTATTTGYLHSVDWYLGKSGTPNGKLTCYLMGYSGTVGTNAVPNATVFATSGTINMADLGAAADTTFSFDASYQIVLGKTYSIVLAVTNETGCSASSYVTVTYGSGGSSATNRADFTASAWASATTDYRVKVYGDTVLSSTPTPIPATPTTTASPDGMSTVINTVITPANILLFIALVIIIIPAILGAKFAGGWGFLAGLNVGVILVVVFSVIDYALWIAVLIGMVDAVAVVRGMTGAGKAETVSKGE